MQLWQGMIATICSPRMRRAVLVRTREADDGDESHPRIDSSCTNRVLWRGQSTHRSTTAQMIVKAASPTVHSSTRNFVGGIGPICFHDYFGRSFCCISRPPSKPSLHFTGSNPFYMACVCVLLRVSHVSLCKFVSPIFCNFRWPCPFHNGVYRCFSMIVQDYSDVSRLIMVLHRLPSSCHSCVVPFRPCCPSMFVAHRTWDPPATSTGRFHTTRVAHRRPWKASHGAHRIGDRRRQRTGDTGRS